MNKIGSSKEIIQTCKNLKSRNYDVDLYLYAKGWYKKTNLLKDLQRIYSLRNNIEPCYINYKHIINCMGILVFHHLSKNADFGKNNFIDFIMDIGPDDDWKTKKYEGEYDFYLQVISKFLSILCMSTVEEMPENIKNLLESTKPSALILPLNEGN